jgi:Arc/MetJ-type ribon-helix-helix transcriptional regulator
MTIYLPENLESSILAAVHSGRYASLDDAMAEAASLLLQRLRQEQAQANLPAATQAEAAQARKPICGR